MRWRCPRASSVRAAIAARGPSAAKVRAPRGRARSPTCARRSSAAKAEDIDGIMARQRPVTESRRMFSARPPPAPRVLLAAAGVALLLALSAGDAPPAAAAADTGLEPQAERAMIGAWRAQRVEALTSDGGWLTLAGLFWLQEGNNSFGRASSNSLVLDNPALAERCGNFIRSGHAVRFVAAPGSGVTHAGNPVSDLELTPDPSPHPTVLASGSLRFFVIERAGNLGVRVRDLNNPHRSGFQGFSYFPVSTDWVFDARFEPYQPVRRIRIINILGMEQE